ncbi:hypothetical protein VP01_277g2 [Puccinia sorghi]|uniref:Uncharacterized protein n=1 Tax=Puccinia sorghi TaxID=27349 RepID=A0A0L6V3F4_9BASI|nr:hypothetical protein VP01_277g2 [Puccinia sorghi]
MNEVFMDLTSSGALFPLSPSTYITDLKCCIYFSRIFEKTFKNKSIIFIGQKSIFQPLHGTRKNVVSNSLFLHKPPITTVVYLPSTLTYLKYITQKYSIDISFYIILTSFSLDLILNSLFMNYELFTDLMMICELFKDPKVFYFQEVLMVRNHLQVLPMRMGAPEGPAKCREGLEPSTCGLSPERQFQNFSRVQALQPCKVFSFSAKSSAFGLNEKPESGVEDAHQTNSTTPSTMKKEGKSIRKKELRKQSKKKGKNETREHNVDNNVKSLRRRKGFVEIRIQFFRIKKHKRRERQKRKQTLGNKIRYWNMEDEKEFISLDEGGYCWIFPLFFSPHS